MVKINNKGLSLVEVVLAMAVVSGVVISMFHVIMTYQTEEVEETIKSDIIEYKNIMTKIVQDDIIYHNLQAVALEAKTSSKYTFKLYFKKPFGSIYYKTLTINSSDTNVSSNYIEYQDYKGSGMSTIHYELPNVDANPNCNSTECNISRFSSINTNINVVDTGTYRDYSNKYILDSDGLFYNSLGFSYFNLDITISNPNVEVDNHILISSPLDYSYCGG